MRPAYWIALLALAGCAGLDPLPRPAEGYRAIRFVQPLRIPGPLGFFEPGAGTVLVEDRAGDGRSFYCGVIPFRDLMTNLAPICATYDGRLLTLAADRLVSRPPFEVPPGSIEEFRLR